MKKTYLFALFLAILSSCGDLKPSGDIVLQEKKLPDFDQLELHGKFNLSLSQQKQNLLTLESYPNILGNLDIEVKDKTLIIKEKKPAYGVDFYNLNLGSTQAIGSYHLSDSVVVMVAGKQKLTHLNIKMSDKSKMMGIFDSPKAKIQVSAWAQLNLQGQSQNASIISRDSATIIAPYWQVGQLDIDAQQHTYTELSAREMMAGNLSQKAQLVYYGEAKQKLKLQQQAKVQLKKLN
jgi:Putative auto-transporter adhesin, head GIN domain